MANSQILFCGNNPKFLSADLVKQSNTANGGTAFRIPSIVNANGTLVAAVDKAATGCDWGYIELAVRTSKDNGKTWSDIKTVAAPPAREIVADEENIKTAFFIDPCMTVAANGDVIMIATFFPESKGVHNKKLLDSKKVAFASFDGKVCPLIYDRDGNFYYVTDNGTVLDKTKANSGYTVKGLGELYKGDEYCGNIYLNGAVGKTELESTATTYGAPLKAPKRSYVFMLKSSDCGETWSEPVDITHEIQNANDGVFLGVAPGAGLTTKTGRIIMPLYTLKGTVAIYSDDNGNTWNRNPQIQYTGNVDEWCAVEAPTGDLYSFGRAKKYAKTPVSISADDGLAWITSKKAAVKAPKCQKSAIIVNDTIYIAHPSSKKRENGMLTAGTFTYNKKGKFKGITWQKDKVATKINDGFFAYSCMAKIDDKTIAIVYEDQPSSHIVFETISL